MDDKSKLTELTREQKRLLVVLDHLQTISPDGLPELDEEGELIPKAIEAIHLIAQAASTDGFLEWSTRTDSGENPFEVDTYYCRNVPREKWTHSLRGLMAAGVVEEEEPGKYVFDPEARARIEDSIYPFPNSASFPDTLPPNFES